MSNPTVPALLQPHLKAFLPLLNKETLIDVVLGMNLELTNEKATVATLTQEVAALSQAINIAANRSDREILSELEDGEVISYVAQCLPTYMVEALPHVAAMTQDFEDKYYGLEMENRRLRKTIELREGSIAELKRQVESLCGDVEFLTKRLAQAEAALGVPCNDEWDSWSDAAMAQGLDASATLFKTLD